MPGLLSAKFFGSVGVCVSLYFGGHTGSGPSPLAPGTATFVGATYSAINLQATPASGGTDPVAVQWQRSARGVGIFSNVAGLTTLAASDTTALASTLYDYRAQYTDAAATVVYSNVIPASLAFSSAGGRAGVILLQYPPARA